MLLQAVETHGCLSGCYSHESPVDICVSPQGVPARAYHVQCEDCLSFHVGALASCLPPSMTQYALARELTDHMRKLRGYLWSVSGYHTRTSSWLTAVSLGNGLLLVDAARNRGPTNDVKALIDAFLTGIVSHDEPGMLDHRNYRAQVVYLDLTRPLATVKTAQDILSAPQCVASPRPGHRRAALLEYLPALGLPAPVATAPDDTSPAPARPIEVGDICPRCGARVEERPLLTGSFIGCRC